MRSVSAAVLLRRCPVPQRLAGFVGQFVDGIDHRLHLLVAEYDGAQHHVFGKLHGLGLDHQHRLAGTGHDQIQVART